MKLAEDMAGRLRKRMIEKGVNQSELARRAGVTRQQSYKWVSGIIPVSSRCIPSVCEALEITPNQLFGVEE